MSNQKIKTYPLSGNSLLDLKGLNSLNLNNPSQAKHFLKIALELNPSIATSKSAQNSNVVDFDETIFGPINYTQALERTLGTKSAVDEDDKKKKNSDDHSSKWRHLTKHRIVTSFVTGYLTAFGEAIPPYNVLITSACAPNAMNIYIKDNKNTSPSSPEDLSFFFRNDNDPKLSNYKKMMKLTYERCLYAQIREGTQVLIIPPLGLGVYLNALDSKTQKAAKKANYQALCEAIDSIDSIQGHIKKGLYHTNNLKEIICVSPPMDIAKSVFSTYQGSIPVTLATQTDALETAQKLYQAGHTVGMINAGSDRTIGGGYEKVLGDFKKTQNQNKFPPMEEMLSLATDLVYRQAKNISSPQYHHHQYKAFPKWLCCDLQIKQNNLTKKQNQNNNTIPPQASTAAYQKQASLNSQSGTKKIEKKPFNASQFGAKIRKWIAGKNQNNLGGMVWVYPAKNNNCNILFQTQPEANLFIHRLAKVNITSQTHPGKPKTVWQFPNKKHFFVRLTPNDVNQLEKKFVKTSLSQPINISSPGATIPTSLAGNQSGQPKISSTSNTTSYSLNHSKSAAQNDRQQKENPFNGKQFLENIKKCGGTIEGSLAGYNNSNRKILFLTREEASSFVDQLKQVDITSQTYPRLKKEVQQKKGTKHFFVVLTPDNAIQLEHVPSEKMTMIQSEPIYATVDLQKKWEDRANCVRPKKLGKNIREWIGADEQKKKDLRGEVQVTKIKDKEKYQISFKTNSEASFFANKLKGEFKTERALSKQYEISESDHSDLKDKKRFCITLTPQEVVQLDQFFELRDTRYENFQEEYLKLAKQKTPRLLGFFPRPNMDFKKYWNIDRVKKYAADHPKSIGAKAYHEINTSKNPNDLTSQNSP